jgi:hypothetical protein
METQTEQKRLPSWAKVDEILRRRTGQGLPPPILKDAPVSHGTLPKEPQPAPSTAAERPAIEWQPAQYDNPQNKRAGFVASVCGHYSISFQRQESGGWSFLVWYRRGQSQKWTLDGLEIIGKRIYNKGDAITAAEDHAAFLLRSSS